MLVGARPVYLQADPLNIDEQFTGICKGISLLEICQQLEENPGAKMLCITNCTFDGYVHNSKSIIKTVLKKLKDMQGELSKVKATLPEDFIFLFDEAWFGAARFIPELLPTTAMYACKEIQQARVYVTQSTHKTLVAFRQGSMIHTRDPKFDKIKYSFDEAIYTHTTTSPNYNIIASLDAERMWADLDGARICKGAWSIAKKIRHSLVNDKSINRCFKVLTEIDLGICEENNEFSLDIMKITLMIKRGFGLTGEIVRRNLFIDHDIQFNKCTNNTILLMVNAGTTESTHGHLIGALRQIAKVAKEKNDPPENFTLSDELFKQRVEFLDNNNDLRKYFFGLMERKKWKENQMKTDKIRNLINNRQKKVISANFVIPYPPGFPILVPGQVVTSEILDYLENLRTSEIHGMPSDKTLRIWS